MIIAALVFAALSHLVISPVTSQGDFYQGCGQNRGCVGVPLGCLSTTSCTMAISYYAVDKDNYQMEILGNVTGGEKYVAVGLSPGNMFMGDDNVMACLSFNTPRMAPLRVDMSWNDNYTNARLVDFDQGLSDFDVTVVDNFARCKFKREAKIHIEEGGTQFGDFDLNSMRFYFLFSRGVMDGEQLAKHGKHDRFADNTQTFLGEYNKFLKEEVKTYRGCGEEKGCLGYPEGCVKSLNCSMLFTYVGVSDHQYRMELQGFQQQYVAFVLSADTALGSDSVVACSDNFVKRYWCTDQIIRLANPMVGLSNVTRRREADYLYCSFVHDSAVTFPVPSSGSSVSIDLNMVSYNVLLSLGPIEGDDIVSKIEAHTVTEEAMRLVEFNNYFGADVYGDCTMEKPPYGCFGMPDGCLHKPPCDVLVTYLMSKSNGSVAFAIVGKIPERHYAALGLSRDNMMGEDSVMLCSFVGGGVDKPMGSLNMTWNQAHVGNKPLTGQDPHTGILGDPKLTYKDGFFNCSFIREKETTLNDITTNNKFDLKNDKYFLLLAVGPLDASGLPDKHSTRQFSGAAVDLGSFSAVGADKNVEIKLHGCFMVTAWYLTGSLGIFTARYCRKGLFQGRKIMGKDAWFPIHQGFMLCTWVIALTAFIIMIVKFLVAPLEWTRIQKNPHAALGLASLCLMFIQPFMALVRCHPGDRYRPIFNWFHRTVGFSAVILALSAILLATQKSFPFVLPSGAQEIAISYIVFFAIWHIALTIYSCVISKRNSVHKVKEDAHTDKVIVKDERMKPFNPPPPPYGNVKKGTQMDKVIVKDEKKNGKKEDAQMDKAVVKEERKNGKRDDAQIDNATVKKENMLVMEEDVQMDKAIVMNQKKNGKKADSQMDKAIVKDGKMPVKKADAQMDKAIVKDEKMPVKKEDTHLDKVITFGAVTFIVGAFGLTVAMLVMIIIS